MPERSILALQIMEPRHGATPHAANCRMGALAALKEQVTRLIGLTARMHVEGKAKLAAWRSGQPEAMRNSAAGAGDGRRRLVHPEGSANLRMPLSAALSSPTP